MQSRFFGCVANALAPRLRGAPAAKMATATHGLRAQSRRRSKSSGRGREADGER
jgi:hypothetical protein